MTSTPQRIKTGRGYIIFVVVLSSLVLAISVGVFYVSFLDNRYPNIILLGFGILISILPLLLLGSLYFAGDVVIHDDRVDKYTISGRLHKSFRMADVEKWYVLVGKGNYSSLKSLTIIHKAGKYKVTTLEEAFHPLHDRIVQEEQIRGIKLNDTPKAETRRRKEYAIGAGIWLFLTIIMIWGGCKMYKGELLKDITLAYIKGVVTEKGKGKGQNFHVRIKGIPDHTFYAESREMYELINIGDTVEMGIDSMTYLKKIAHRLPLSFSDKYINYRPIRPATMAIGDSEITKPNYNGTPPDETTGSIVIAVAGILFLCMLWIFFRLWRGDTMEHFFRSTYT